MIDILLALLILIVVCIFSRGKRRGEPASIERVYINEHQAKILLYKLDKIVKLETGDNSMSISFQIKSDSEFNMKKWIVKRVVDNGLNGKYTSTIDSRFEDFLSPWPNTQIPLDDLLNNTSLVVLHAYGNTSTKDAYIKIIDSLSDVDYDYCIHVLNSRVVDLADGKNLETIFKDIIDGSK